MFSVLKKFIGKTPTSLPPTMLQFSENIGFSLSLEQARHARMVEIIGIGDYPGKGKWKDEKGGTEYPYFYVRISFGKGSPVTSIESHKFTSRKKARDAQREVTRKLAMFIFENQDAKFEPAESGMAVAS